MAKYVLSERAAREITEATHKVLSEPYRRIHRAKRYEQGTLQIYIAKPDADIDALSGTTPGSGEATVYRVDSSGDLASRSYTKTIWNLSTSVVSSASYVACVQELASGKLIIAAGGGSQYKPWCSFSLDEELETSDEWVTATIEEQFGQGTTHTTTSIILWNMETADGSYEFYGDSGDMGYAFFDKYEVDSAGDYGPADATVAHWRCNPIECP